MRPIARNRSRARAVALALALPALLLAACGEDDPAPAGPPSFEAWSAAVAGICSDGTQEAVALPPPTAADEIAADAARMAETVLAVRDGILPLGAPEGRAEQVDAYLAELTEDAKLLRRISDAAAAGEETLALRGKLDESAGRAALALDLTDCAAFANAVARTP